MVGRAGENRRAMYKRCGAGAAKFESRRQQMAEEKKNQRCRQRNEAFTARRGLQIEEPIPAVNTRQKRLEEWKKKKEEMSKESARKPAFIVGKITYNDMHLYRPPESSSFRPPKGVLPVITPQPQRVLRSRTKLQFNKPTVQQAIRDFASGLTSTSVKKQIKIVKTVKKDTTDVLNRTFDGTESPKIDSKTNFNQISAQNGLLNVPNIPNSTRRSTQAVITDLLNRTFDESELLASMNDSTNNRSSAVQKHEQQLSGNVYATKQNSQHMAITESTVSNNYASEVHNIREPLINGHENVIAEEKTAEYFRKLFNQAVSKLNSLCDTWIQLARVEELPNSVSEDIDVAVGMARLLISQKLKQFGDLILEHENSDSSCKTRVLTTDLDGFWGMVNKQVEELYRKFETLENIKQNNWQEPLRNEDATRAVAQINNRKCRVKRPQGTSGVRSFLAQMRRKAKKDGDENSDELNNLFEIQSNTIIRPMSPVVMRVNSRAKLIGSPQIRIPSIAKVKSPVSFADQENSEVVVPPKSTKKTPRLRKSKVNTPDSTPVRRSTRILQNKN